MVLCDGENIADFSTWVYIYIYIILIENTYIFIICYKQWNYCMFVQKNLL